MMAAVILGNKGETIVIAYDPHGMRQGTPISAFETFIEDQRLYRKRGWDLTEAIRHRGPAPNVWKNVDALQQISEKWALRHAIAGSKSSAIEKATFKSHISRTVLGGTLIGYITWADVALIRNKSDPVNWVQCATPPSWLATVERRIRDSVRPRDRDPSDNDGKWIEQNVADSASSVLRVAANLFPSEPYIYASKKGDVVLESAAEGGRMTTIVGVDFALFFIVLGEQEPITKRISFTGDWHAQLNGLQEISEKLRTTDAVDSRP